MRRRFAALVIATVFTALGPGGQRAAAAETVQILSVQSGHSVILQTPGLSRVAVGDGRIAGVLPIGTAQLVINGKAPGNTTVFVWENGRRATYEVTVTEQNMDDLAQMLRTSIDEPGVQIVSFRDSVVVRGTVADGAHYQQLSDILTRFDAYAKEQKYTVINAVVVAHPLGELQKDLAAIPGAGDVRVDVDGKGNVIVSGRVHDTTTAQAVLERARGLAGTWLAANGQLIDRMATDQNSQIDIKVYVLEVDKTAQGDLGMDLQSATFSAGCAWDPTCFVTGSASFPVVEAPHPTGNPLSVGPFFRVTTLAPTLRLLMQSGDAKVLSAPDLVTTPGNLATFLVGGQFPIPSSTGLGQISIQYEPFGVQAECDAHAVGKWSGGSENFAGHLRSRFSRWRFGERFRNTGAQGKQASTDVITQPGESIIMGGMVRHLENKLITKIPLLSSLPILGKLFQSTAYQNNKTDVIFVLTPQVITR